MPSLPPKEHPLTTHFRNTLLTLVDHPEQLQLELILGRRTAVMEMRVARDDFRNVVGRGGRTAEALRHLLSAMAGKFDIKGKLIILEPEDAEVSGSPVVAVRRKLGRSQGEDWKAAG